MLAVNAVSIAALHFGLSFRSFLPSLQTLSFHFALSPSYTSAHYASIAAPYLHRKPCFQSGIVSFTLALCSPQTTNKTPPPFSGAVHNSFNGYLLAAHAAFLLHYVAGLHCIAPLPLHFVSKAS